MNPSRAKRSVWWAVVLSGACASVAMQACSGNFTSCTQTLTCPPSGGTAGVGGEVGGAAGVSTTGGTSAGSHHGGTGGTEAGAAGEGNAAGESGAGGEAGVAGTSPMTTCSPSNPCASGEGPCASDADCDASLVCGNGTGPKFGFAGNACVPKHCTNDVLDGGETSQDCGGGCGCPTFEVLSDSSSCADAVSADGTFVVGYFNELGVQKAVRWTSKTVYTVLGPLTSTPGPSEAFATDAAGDVITGFAAPESPRTEFHVIMWKSPSWTAVDLGALPTNPSTGAAHGISSDGKVVAGKTGEGAVTAHQGFVWTQAGGYKLLGYFNGGPDASLAFSTAAGVSGDGSVVVGTSTDPNAINVAFRWTKAEGMKSLGNLSGVASNANAYGVNSDGTVIVGNADGPSGLEAFRWTSKGMVGLGDLSGGDFASTAYGVSGSGSRVVGQGSSTATTSGEAFFWDDAGGMRTLKDAMAERGFEDPLSAWTFTKASAISADGKVVVGCVTSTGSQSGSIQAFRVRLEP